MTNDRADDQPSAADTPTPAPSTRTTLNLTTRAVHDLEELTAATGLNRTDLINRAVRLLALLHPHLESGTVAIIRSDDRCDRVLVL